MLASLRIRNFALVESLDWDVPPGFVAITGETGAGKSILIDGLKLLLGERADRTAIRAGETECVVEAIVHLDAASPVHEILAAAGLEPCEEGQLILKRLISTAGAGRQFANGSPCTLAVLRQIGDRLVDLHGPHDHQSLFSRETQRDMLDAFAGARDVFAAYRDARSRWLDLQREKDEGEAAVRSREREIDLLAHQSAEIEEAELKEGEEEELLGRQQIGANAQRLQQISGALVQALTESEDSVASRLADAARLLREFSRLDPAQEILAGRLAALTEELVALGNEIAGYGANIESDPGVLARVEERLDLLQSLKRKYGASIAEVMEFHREADERLAALRAQVERRADLDQEIAAARGKVLGQGAKLSKLRQGAAPKLAASVRRHLRDLGFLKGGFEVRLDAGDPSSDGLEAVEFVFAPNPGEPPLALRAIASSGEISRVMLALKTSLASQDDVPVLVFDEIDANVGGEVAHAVGGKMREIGTSRQVLCITHLPQVASAASAHVVVNKEVTGGRTVSKVTQVGEGDREGEIARMLGSRRGEAALAHARELLGK